MTKTLVIINNVIPYFIWINILKKDLINMTFYKILIEYSDIVDANRTTETIKDINNLVFDDTASTTGVKLTIPLNKDE